MGLPKFLSLIEREELFLNRADKFEDLFEGDAPFENVIAYSKGLQSLAWLTKKSEEDELAEDKIQEVQGGYIENTIEIKKSAFVSCWNEMDNESYALWQIYAKDYGIAIQTSAKKLKNILKQEKGCLYKVRYIRGDEENQIVVPRYIEREGPKVIENFLVLKKSYYDYEKEVRGIVFKENAESISLEIDDLNDFIEKIYISPFAEKWYVELIVNIAKNKYGLNAEVVNSDIKVNV
ncbi:hypothetical protein EYB33_02840 [Lysinibacillus sphaericus]|uniref:DUF2971 domain-containing protein n=1 Tax=Lysinibacillus sphaericus TaxID=1421 RepID=UPI001E49C510|nr:DUF2971 domain-containing protein [Lysinibacillus sphaericus]UDK95253.1 hypothetical protein EYB33_02840 [Lysinibacillus sphaericus]